MKRYQALTITRRREFALVNRDRVVGGEEMTLAELEAADSRQRAAGSVQERTAAGGMMNGAGMSEDVVGRGRTRAAGPPDALLEGSSMTVRET